MGSIESQIMTNVIAAAPSALTTAGEKHGRQRVDICRVVVTATPGTDHLLRLTKLRAHDRVTSILHIGDADAQMDDVNVGIYTPSSTTADPVVIDANGLVEALDLSGADAIPTEILGYGKVNPQDFGKALWEYCEGGPASEPDPGTEYEICASSASDPAGGDQTYVITYTAGD